MNDRLYHHGIKGMKWGVRRYQDKNGRLTSKGRARYIADKTKGVQKDIDSFSPYLKTGIRSSNGKLVMTSKEVKDIVNALEMTKKKLETKCGEKYDKVAARVNSDKQLKRKVNDVKENMSTKTTSEAKKELDSKVKKAFDKHPELYNDFGGPDQVDDYEYLALVMMEYGYDNDIDF